MYSFFLFYDGMKMQQKATSMKTTTPKTKPTAVCVPLFPRSLGENVTEKIQSSVANQSQSELRPAFLCTQSLLSMIDAATKSQISANSADNGPQGGHACENEDDLVPLAHHAMFLRCLHFCCKEKNR